MTNRTDYPRVEHHESDAPQPASRRWATTWSIRTASITAGVALLLMSAVAIFGKVVAVDGLVTEGNAAQTATDIMASEGLFRLGIASLVVVIALDVVVAWALYRVFSPVNKSLSMLAMALRLVYSGVFMVAIGHLLGAVRLLSNDGYLAVSGADQVNAQAMLEITTFNDIWYVEPVPVRSPPAPHRLPRLPIRLRPQVARRPDRHLRSRLCQRQPRRGALPGQLDRYQLVHLHRRVLAGALARDPGSPHRCEHLSASWGADRHSAMMSPPD